MNYNQEIKVMRRQPASAIQWLGDMKSYSAIDNFLRPRVSYAMFIKDGISPFLSIAYKDKMGSHDIDIPNGTWLVFENNTLEFFDPVSFNRTFRVFHNKEEIREETDSIMATELARKLNAAVEAIGDYPVINSLTMSVPGGDGFSYVVYHRGDDHFELE